MLALSCNQFASPLEDKATTSSLGFLPSNVSNLLVPLSSSPKEPLILLSTAASLNVLANCFASTLEKSPLKLLGLPPLAKFSLCCTACCSSCKAVDLGLSKSGRCFNCICSACPPYLLSTPSIYAPNELISSSTLVCIFAASGY